MNTMRLAFLLLLSISFSSFASNLTTSTIGVYWAGSQQVVINLQKVYFCTADSIPLQQEVLITSSCGDSIWNFLSGSHHPYPALANCEIEDCSGNTPRRFTRFTYTDTVDLVSSCSDWVVHHFSGARNGASNVMDGQSQYIYTSVSPFTNVLGPELSQLIVRKGEVQGFNVGAVSFSDSVVCEIAPIMTHVNNFANYKVGHVYDMPFDSVTLTNGYLSLVHDSVDYRVLGVKNTLYENGVVVGESFSEVAIHVSDVDFNSHGPQWLSPGLIPLLSNVTPVDSLTVHVNPGDTLAFEMQFADSNLDDSLFFLGGPSNGFQYRASGINPLRITAQARAPLGDTTMAIPFIVSDSVCSDKNFYGTFFIRVGTGVGTGSVIQKEEWKVYPNPASIAVRVNGLWNPTNYCLYDVSGRLVQKGMVSSSMEIAVTHIKSGMYILQLSERRFLLQVE